MNEPGSDSITVEGSALSELKVSSETVGSCGRRHRTKIATPAPRVKQADIEPTIAPIFPDAM
jgi:hypothetical protein